MLAVGLTGGIGSGKSTVADLLVERGAELIDADQIAREVVEPGRPAHGALVERFGPGILAPDGTLDRPAVAAVAFSDPAALADLNAITHPAIGESMLARRQAADAREGVLVLAIPLLKPAHRDTVRLDVVVVVDCPVEVAVERLVESRDMERADAEARVAAQISREERVGEADYVVDNGGDLGHLEGEVDRLWEWLEERRKDL
ncbi:MAG TPA: dephospho-CoA kinase [Acidimicrobiales bacterium]|nr:dephospho-CoA kinase [Acidimicrobiales bacterium]